MSQNLFAHKDFLNLKGNDVYVDLGGGRGNTVIVSKLMNPDITAISIEIDKERHQQAIAWNEKNFRKKLFADDTSNYILAPYQSWLMHAFADTFADFSL